MENISNRSSQDQNEPAGSDLDARDALLLRQISDQDRDAMAELYDRHSALLYSILMAKLADPVEAQDILHDVFVKLHTQASRYNPALGKPIAWLTTMARNAAIDRLRKKSTHQRYVVKMTDQPQMGPDPVCRAGADEVERLTFCVGALPDSQREILKLAYFGGYTQQEIANQLAHPLGTVKTYIRRALIKLRNCIEGGQAS
jgi:RNA polymerase sigma-70 factor (ECF subfamily)